MARKTFRIVLIKPSHYDADGYVIQWWRPMIASNSLASVYGLFVECAEQQALGPMSTLTSTVMTNATPLSTSRELSPRSAPPTAASRIGRRAVEPISPRARSRARVPRRRYHSGDGRLPCFRLHLDAAESAARLAGGARPRRDAVRRRRRRADGRVLARHRGRHSQADLQLSLRLARNGGRDATGALPPCSCSEAPQAASRGSRSPSACRTTGTRSRSPSRLS